MGWESKSGGVLRAVVMGVFHGYRLYPRNIPQIFWMVGFQLDDDSKRSYLGEMVGNHHFHPLQTGCL